MNPDTAIIPPDLTRPTPRHVRITGHGVTSAVVAAVAMALGLAIAIKLGLDISQKMKNIAALHGEGAVTEGEVTGLAYEGRGHVLVARYSFAVGGNYLTGRADVPRDLEQEFQLHSPLFIRFVPSNPAVNHPAAWEDSARSDWIVEIVPAMPVALGVWLFVLLGREKKLLIAGSPAIATITDCTRGRNGFFARYEFQTAEGQRATGGYTYSRPQEIGAMLCILYMPQKEDSNEPCLQLDSYRIAD
jgi:hypothetical protein